MDQETLDALLKKGAIQQSTRDMLPPSAPEAVPSPEAGPAPAEALPTPQATAPTPQASAPIAPPMPAAAVPQTPQTIAAQGIQPASAIVPAVATPGEAGKGIKLASDEKRVVPVGDATSPLERSFELEQQALAQGGAAGAKQAAAEAGYIAETQKQMQKMADVSAVAEADRKKQLDERMQSVDQAAKEAAKVGDVDPNRLYKNMGTGQKIVTALSVFLGGFSKDGNNLALKMLTDSVDSDIAAQKNAQEQAKGKVTQQQTLYGDMLKRFGDDRQAEAATRITYLNNMELQLKKAAAQYKGPQVQAQTTMGLAHIEQQKQMVKAQFQKAVEDKQAKDRVMGGSVSSETADIERLSDADKQRVVPGVGLAVDHNAAEKARTLQGNTQAMAGMIDEIKALREKHGSETMPGEALARMQTLGADLQLAVKEAKAMGTLDAGAERFMNKLVGDPSRWAMNSSVIGQLDALKGSVQLQTKAKLRPLMSSMRDVKYSAPK